MSSNHYFSTHAMGSSEANHRRLLDLATTGKFTTFKNQLALMLKHTLPEQIFQPKGKGSPLILAAQKGHYKIVSYILKNFSEHIDLEHTISVISEFTGNEVKGASALWSAALGGHVEVVRDLVEAGVDVNHPNATNSTPLRAASYHDRVDVIELLLSKGADLNIANHVGQSPVMIAVLRRNVRALKLLITLGKANINQATGMGIDSLHLAIENESDEIFKLLISLGASIIWPHALPPQPIFPSNFTIPEVYTPPCHLYIAAKHHNDFAMNFLRNQPECIPAYEVDMLLVRGIERIWDNPSPNVTEVWKKALELREQYALPYPGNPATELYEGVQEVRTLTDVYNISQRRYLIQCVLITERVFGPLFATSCDLKVKLVCHLFRDGPESHSRCCELLYQLLEATIKRPWMSTQTSVNDLTSLLQTINRVIPSFNAATMTMEKFAAFTKMIFTRYNIIHQAIIEKNPSVLFDKCFSEILKFLNSWLQKHPDFNSIESIVVLRPVLKDLLQTLFYPLSRDHPIYHVIMKSRHFQNYENLLNVLISFSTPDMLEVSNKAGYNALHFACQLETVPDSVIHTLIRTGAHLDSVTPTNQTPIETCLTKFSPQYLTIRSYYPLKLACLSAQTIVQGQLPTDSLPAFFHTFINLHRVPPPRFNE